MSIQPSVGRSVYLQQQGQEGEQIGEKRGTLADASDVDVMGFQGRSKLGVVDGSGDLLV